MIFNEATAHGTLPWHGKNERRIALYRYTPKYLHYAGGIYEATLPDWVSELTEAQRAVLEPPYIYHHPLVEDDGETVVRPRREGEGLIAGQEPVVHPVGFPDQQLLDVSNSKPAGQQAYTRNQYLCGFDEYAVAELQHVPIVEEDMAAGAACIPAGTHDRSGSTF